MAQHHCFHHDVARISKIFRSDEPGAGVVSATKGNNAGVATGTGRTTENQVSLDSQFPTKLEERTEGRIAIADIVWPAFQNRLADSFTDLILEDSFSIRASREGETRRVSR